MKQLTLFISVIFILFLCCNATDSNQSNNIETLQTTNYKLLSLGDSYTIGESVCETCRFPEQLKDSLINNTENTDFNLKVVATTGWTTTNLLNGISNENLPNNYDLVTLLIGVNNQYQEKDFSIYETEFPELVDIAITKAKGDKNRVIVVSIPDYAFTPFGNGNTTISSEIDAYNAFAENYCNANNITFVNITDITRNGLEDTDLVASDGLHPSKKAYSLFVERLLPYALEKL
ncbi:SGNH/GDSL hydrolase family protein [Mesoflavibacter zeaxanthinifaciens]|uniref:SGNH/GDSL hydrolase family protein n=1 Tax=Mesoflavibacter zeaxanthinifaciens TaxID=393060 RepID=UPI003A944D98